MIVSYNWLKEFVGEAMPSPEEVAKLISAHTFEIDGLEPVGDDVAIDIDTLPDRGSDCLSHRGIAKELAVILKRELAHDPLATSPTLPSTDAITVDIEDPSRCPRFTATLITGIEVKDSPQWLQDRLRTLGQRSINNVVDATNYVMYAMGQPLHAYDAARFPQVDGTWQFVVRTAHPGEMVSLLSEGGKEEERDIELSGTELLIVDGSSDTPIGLAGVKGGRFAGVTEATTSVIIEAANFDAATTRQTARRLGIVIDASKRFENGPSRELPLYGQAEIITLITKIAGGNAEGTIDVYPLPEAKPTVTVRAAAVNALLGLTLPLPTMVDIVTRLGATVAETEEGFTATAPFVRTDLNIEEDYIEEIGRLYGYEHIAAVVPEPAPLCEVNARQYYSDQIRQALTEAGFNEVITSSFRKKDTLRLANALASDKGYMRSSLRPNLETVLEQNVPHVDLIGAHDVRIFEIGTVFNYEKETKTISQHTALAIGVRTKHSGYTPKDDAKLAEGIAAAQSVLGQSVQFDIADGIAELNLAAAIDALPAPSAYDSFPPAADVTYQPFSSFPAVSRDIALWTTAGTTAADVETLLNTHAGALRVRTTLFDEFTKEGRTSFAFRLVFQSNEKTLTDSEVNAIMDGINAAAAKAGWEVR